MGCPLGKPKKNKYIAVSDPNPPLFIDIPKPIPNERSLILDQLKDLCQKFDESMAAYNILINQNLVQILGISGVGKSTYINFLNGTKFQVEDRGYNGIKLIVQDNERLISEMGDDFTSKTKKIIYFQSTYRNNVLYICDTPGFLDSSGFIGDLINIYATKYVINNAQSIKIIFMLDPIQYSSARGGGRGQYLRDVIGQLVQMFQQFNEYQDSFLLVFNHLKKCDEESEINYAIQQIEKLRQSIEGQEGQEIKNFCKLLIKKLQNKQYIIFEPQYNQNNLNNYLEMIHSNTQSINNEQIQRYIKASLNSKSESQFKDFLEQSIECLRYFIQNGLSEQASDILCCLYKLRDYVKMDAVVDKYNKAIQEVQELESMVESFQLKFKNYITIEQQDNQLLCKHLLEIIKCTLNFYLAIKLFYDKTKQELKVANNIEKINIQIRENMDLLVEQAMSSSSFKFKFLQLEKIKFICDNKEFKEEFERISNKFDKLGKHVLSDNFSPQKYQNIKKDIDENCQIASDKLNQMLNNKIIPEDIKEILRNLKFIHDKKYETNSTIIGYTQLKERIKDLIKKFISDVEKLRQNNGSLIQESYIENIAKTFQFIKQICSQYNTDDHFQDQQQEYLKCQNSIKDILNQFYIEVDQTDEPDSVYKYLKLIYFLTCMDDETTQQAHANNKNYKKFENKINQFFDQINQEYKEEISTCKQIMGEYVQQIYIQVIPVEFISRIKQNAIKIQKLLDNSYWTFKHIQTKTQEIQKEYNKHFINDIESEINSQIADKNEITQNFKLIQIIVASLLGNCEYETNVQQFKLKIQQQQIDFLQLFYRWCLTLINFKQLQSIQQYDLTDLEKLNQSILDIENYLVFLKNLKDHICNNIEIIYQQTVQRSEKLKKQEINILQQVVRQGYDLQIIYQIDQRISDAKNKLLQLQNFVTNWFRETYQFDLENMEELKRKDINEINIILSQIKELYESDYTNINKLFQTNKYQEAQRIIQEDLERRLQDNRNISDNQIQFKLDNLKQIQQDQEQLKDHLVEIDFDKEKLKLEAVQQQLNQNMTNFLLEDRFKEASEYIKNLEQSQQQIFNKKLDEKVESVINSLKDYKNKFIKAPTQQLSQRVIHQFIIFSEIITNFNNIPPKYTTQVESQIKQINQKLIVNLFSQLDISEEQQSNSLITIARCFFVNIENQINNYFKGQKHNMNIEINPNFREEFKSQILQKFKQVEQNVQTKNQQKKDIHKCVNVLINMYFMMRQLKCENIIDDNEIKNTLSQFKNEFNNTYLTDQTKRFIQQNHTFNADQIEKYMYDHFSRIWEFFMMKEIDKKRIIQNFIKCQSNIIQDIEKLVKNQDVPQLLRQLRLNKESLFIEYKIKEYLEKKQSIILTQYIPQNNFLKVKQSLDEIKSFENVYKSSNERSMKQYILSIYENITHEIIQIWNKLKENNINKPYQVQQSLQTILKLMTIIKDCDITQIKNEINLKNLVALLQGSLNKKLQEIKQCIDKLDYEQTIKIFLDLRCLLEQKISFMNKKRNYIMVYGKILRLSFQQAIIQNQIKGEGESLIKQFENINTLFQNLIKDQIKKLTQQFEDLYQHKQYEKISQIQDDLQIFCQKVNQQEQLVELNNAILFINLIEKKYEEFYQQAIKISKSGQIDLKGLVLISKNLKEIEEYFVNISDLIRQKNYQINVNKIFEKQIELMITSAKSQIEKFQNDNQSKELFVKNLIHIYKSIKELESSHFLIKNIGNLIELATKNQEMNVVLDLISYLNKDEDGLELREKHQELFKIWLTQLINSKIAGQNNIEYVKDNLQIKQAEGDIEFVKDDLFKQYEQFKIIYDQLNQEVAQLIQDKQKLTDSIKKKAEQFKQKGNYLQERLIIWDTEQKKQLIQMLAEVCALWSIIDREGSDSKATRFIHTIQVITIMRLLNIDSEKTSQLYNHIAQVRTGEGKSIALGIISTMFALIGFEVDCCCYSQYLSERDYNDFESFFINYSIQKLIQYNTFYKLTEKIINQPNDHRNTFEDYLHSKSSQNYLKNNSQQVKKILIVDELDFFFGENFLGQVYAVGSQFKSEKIVNLMKLIWKKRQRGINIDDIRNTQEYKEIFDENDKLRQMRNFIDQKIEQMINDARSMEKHTYFLDRVQNGVERVIAYQEIDGVSHNSVQGYKTAFAYLQEWQRKKITKEQLYNNLSLNFNIGCFSYPKIIDCYSLVLGVTGTLQSMTNFQIDQMKKLCNIQKQTITPSIYGESKFQFNPSTDVFLCAKKKDYFQQILGQINEMISKNRSTIVFFENQQNLFEFYQYLNNNGIKEVLILTEQASNKKSIIAKAAYCNAITLATKPFGRGTDFKCYDRTLIKNGGIHIIQTFLSETIAEQIQIQGRTARQGDPGSYSLVVLQECLNSKFNVQLQNSPTQGVYEYLNTLRVEFQGKKDQELDAKQKEAEIYHIYSMQLKNLFYQEHQDYDRINKLLIEIAVYGDKKENKISKPSEQINQINDEEMKNAKKDKFGVAIDKKFDLAKDGSSNHLSILIGQFCRANDCDVTSDIQKELKTSLKEKGYKKFEITTDEKTFVDQSSQYDQLWVISGSEFNSKDQNIEKNFVDSILQHLKQRKGLFLLTDNEPFFYHANLVLKQIPIGYNEQTPVYMKLEGNDRGNNTLKKGKYSEKLQFGYHNITHGLDYIYEGNTICYPKIINNNNKMFDNYDDFLDLEIIGTSETKKPCIFALNGTNKRGRIAFDCGFTKILSSNWGNTPGTSRYIQNIYSWLYFLDREEG